MMQIGMNNEVLVIGAGRAGLAAAEKIAGQGYAVTMVESGADAGSVPGGIRVLEQEVLEKLEGFAGQFEAVFLRDGNRTRKTFGAVVAAPEYDTVVAGEPYGLTVGGKVITQGMLEEYLSSDAGLAKMKNGSGASVAFLTGYGKESCPENFERIIKSAIAVQKIENCSSYLFAKNVKVGGEGLEKLFTEGRHQGVVCFKPEETPRVEQEGGGLTIRCMDPVVRTRMELAPDYVVLEEIEVPGDAAVDLARRLKIDRDLDGYLQSNNVHRFPVNTNREGIYVAQEAGSAVSIALRINELLYDGARSVPEDKVTVDSERCVLCLTCYRCCPHGAITWNNDAAVISPVACFGCGICASECPMDAIQLGEFADDEVARAVHAGATSGKSPAVVAFLCENSGLEAFETAKKRGAAFPEGVKAVRVPCAGKIDAAFIWKALAEGADGVMIAVCHEGNCRSENGNSYAAWRVEEISRRLEAMGLDREKVVFVNLASNMADTLEKVVAGFVEKQAVSG